MWSRNVLRICERLLRLVVPGFSAKLRVAGLRGRMLDGHQLVCICVGGVAMSLAILSKKLYDGSAASCLALLGICFSAHKAHGGIADFTVP